MRLSLKDYEVLDGGSPIGEGSFSEVFKVRERATGRLFALKKVDLLKLSPQDWKNLEVEIKVHEDLRHRHVIGFYGSLQLGNVVYILLEHAQNGCLFYYINGHKGLPEDLALRFFAQICTAVQYIHSRDIVHRDIKPENILLDKDFCVKLCDFGWSASLRGPAKTRNSICGTFEYMAPEVIYQATHSYKADVWGLGILLYELLHGNPPFRARTLPDMRDEFVSKPIQIYDEFSEGTKELLQILLQSDNDRRPGIEEVLKHPLVEHHLKTAYLPIPPETFKTLYRNYLINSDYGRLRFIPEDLERLATGFITPRKIEPPRLILPETQSQSQSQTNVLVQPQPQVEAKPDFQPQAQTHALPQPPNQVQTHQYPQINSEAHLQPISQSHVHLQAQNFESRPPVTDLTITEHLNMFRRSQGGLRGHSANPGKSSGDISTQHPSSRFVEAGEYDWNSRSRQDSLLGETPGRSAIFMDAPAWLPASRTSQPLNGEESQKNSIQIGGQRPRPFEAIAASEPARPRVSQGRTFASGAATFVNAEFAPASTKPPLKLEPSLLSRIDALVEMPERLDNRPAMPKSLSSGHFFQSRLQSSDVSFQPFSSKWV